MSGRSGEPMGEVPEAVAVEELVTEVCERAGAVSLPVDVAPEVPRSVVVPVRGLVQSLESLVRNALDAGGDRNEVRLRIGRGDDRVRFEVEYAGGVLMPRSSRGWANPSSRRRRPAKGWGLACFSRRPSHSAGRGGSHWTRSPAPGRSPSWSCH